jgi:hypothetical protein
MKNVVDEKLKNSAEILTLFLQRFFNQQDFYQNNIPEEKDLGILILSFNKLKETLNISPRNCINDLRARLPRMLKDKMNNIQKWL